MKLIVFCAVVVHSALGLPQWGLDQWSQGGVQQQWNTPNQQWGNEQLSWGVGGQQNTVDQAQFADPGFSQPGQWDQERQQQLGGPGQIVQDGQQPWDRLSQMSGDGQYFLGGQQVPLIQDLGMGHQFMGGMNPGQGTEQQFMGGDVQSLGRGQNQGLEQPMMGGLNQLQQWHQQVLGGLSLGFGDGQQHLNQGLMSLPWRQQGQESWGADQSIQGNLGSPEVRLPWRRRPPGHGKWVHGLFGHHERHPGGHHGGCPLRPTPNTPDEQQPPADQKPEQSELENQGAGQEQPAKEIPKQRETAQQKPEEIVSQILQLEQKTDETPTVQQNVEASDGETEAVAQPEVTTSESTDDDAAEISE